MIARFSDHAANERTYLAWVLTAIAVMAFGFLVEKFDQFLEVATRTLEGRAAPVRHEAVGDVAGLLLILLGGAMMAVATVRFRKIAWEIDAVETMPAGGRRLDMAMVGSTLFAYLLYTVLRRLV